MNYVIIGAGPAGTTAAEELRKLAPDSHITLISEDTESLYSKVLLPFYLKGKIDRDKLFVKKETWYVENNIEWVAGETVEAIDTKNKFVAVSDGREYPYDKLLICSGCDARKIEEDPRGVSYLRTLADADHLLQLMNEIPSCSHSQGGQQGVAGGDRECRVGIYGGRFIACEYLNIFHHWGFSITLALRGDHLWNGILDEQSGRLLSQHLIEKGIDFVPGAQWQGTLGDSELTGFKTSKGEFDCSLLGVGMGVAPDFSFLKDTEIQTGVGILTNEFLQTSDPDVYAAGDIAEVFDVYARRHLRLGIWARAIAQGRIAAQNMTGGEIPFKQVSSFSMSVLGVDVVLIADCDPKQAQQVVVRKNNDESGIIQLFIRGNKIVGATLVGDVTERMLITKKIQTDEALPQEPEYYQNPQNSL
ncbi:MAG: FAD-dependent oxidoreductase [Patescibacteria group bacterium]